ncbi:hypothetical protein CLG96_18055 [Sphingomonas oleivorans]|uniref:MxaD family protein n=2 Tax=Sphingomonas oleivorans TaxID=1735121 RepID=A0A2T5FTW3_9SPHN|nr:hypothetical protein CLG96_18055 [Sphingomonas oleivorans]
MASASRSIEIAAPAERVWAVVGGFDNLPLWLKLLTNSSLEDGGRVRRLVAIDGSVIVERLLSFDEVARRYSYSHVEAPDPVTDYVGAMMVEEIDSGRSRVTWSSSFVPAGVTEAEAATQLETVYDQGLTDLKSLIERG